MIFCLIEILECLLLGLLIEHCHMDLFRKDGILQEPRAIGDKEGIILVRQTDADMSWLTQAELEIIKVVCERFKDCSSSELSRLSHDEDAWQECISENKRIPFEYAFSLKAI